MYTRGCTKVAVSISQSVHEATRGSSARFSNKVQLSLDPLRHMKVVRSQRDCFIHVGTGIALERMYPRYLMLILMPFFCWRSGDKEESTIQRIVSRLVSVLQTPMHKLRIHQSTHPHWRQPHRTPRDLWSPPAHASTGSPGRCGSSPSEAEDGKVRLDGE